MKRKLSSFLLLLSLSIVSFLASSQILSKPSSGKLIHMLYSFVMFLPLILTSKSVSLCLFQRLFLLSFFFFVSDFFLKKDDNGLKTKSCMASHRIGETGLSDSAPSYHHHHAPYAAALHGMNTHTSFMYAL